MQGVVFEGGGDYFVNEFVFGFGWDVFLVWYKFGWCFLEVKDQIILEWVGVYCYYYVVGMCMVLLGYLSDWYLEMYVVVVEVILVVEQVLCLGYMFGDFFVVYVEVLDVCGYMQYCLNVCGYLLGVCFVFSWMDIFMVFKVNFVVIELNMSIFIYIVLMDFVIEMVMMFGWIYLII